MSRTSIKRSFDLYDSSASSTPPRPPAKRAHIPSDSPTNPFGLYRAHAPQTLPRSTPPAEHLVLRFTLAVPGRTSTVYRVATVPANYTFWHVSRLVRFLFGWRERGVEGDADKDVARGKRWCAKTRAREHKFEVQKEVIMFAATHRAGLIKSGRTWVELGAGAGQADCSHEHEESFMLRNAWPRGVDVTRAITYVHDSRGRRPQTVHITLDTQKDVDADPQSPRMLSNTPRVLHGAGLPDDDDDDDDFALDLCQWNDAHAFEDFITREDGDGGDGTTSEDDGDLSPEERSLRIEAAHARMKQMTSDGLVQIELDEERERKKKLEAMKLAAQRKLLSKPKTRSKTKEDEKKNQKDEEYDPFGDEAEL